MSAEATAAEVRDRLANLYPDERHEQWMARVVLGATDNFRDGTPEVLGVRKRAGREGFSSRVELWAPWIGPGNEVRNFMIRPQWARKGWRLADGGYLRDGGDTHDLLHSLFLHGCQLLELDPWGDNESQRLVWKVRDHLPLYRETYR